MRIQIVLASVLLISCSSGHLPSLTPYKVEIRQGNLITQDMRARLKLGMTQDQVRLLLGSPLINDSFHANRWDYFYSLQQQGKLVDKQRLTLYFAKGGTLSRIDDATSLMSAESAKKEADNGEN